MRRAVVTRFGRTFGWVKLLDTGQRVFVHVADVGRFLSRADVIDVEITVDPRGCRVTRATDVRTAEAPERAARGAGRRAARFTQFADRFAGSQFAGSHD
jgi:hypothetical protein